MKLMWLTDSRRNEGQFSQSPATFEASRSGLEWEARSHPVPRQFDVVIERDSEGYYVDSRLPHASAISRRGHRAYSRSHRTLSGSGGQSGTGVGVRWNPACDHRSMSRAPRVTGPDLIARSQRPVAVFCGSKAAIISCGMRMDGARSCPGTPARPPAPGSFARSSDSRAILGTPVEASTFRKRTSRPRAALK